MIAVLRLGHRKVRDARLSTHVGLVARAEGARGIIFSGERDEKLLASICRVVEKWGGPFDVAYEKDWKRVMKKFSGKKVHLTMYGLPLPAVIRRVRKWRKLLVVVGGEKVPGEVYRLADMNVSVTNQPHSEAGALAVFLHEYFRGKEFGKRFVHAQVRVVPQAVGKKVININPRV